MRSEEEVKRARYLIAAARNFLREGDEGESVMPASFEFQAAALYAIEWVLGVGDPESFANYLAMLEKYRPCLLRKAPPVGEARDVGRASARTRLS